MDIFDLANKSADSILRAFEFSHARLRMRFEVPELDREIVVLVPTNAVIAAVPEDQSVACRTCCINLMDASAHLRTDDRGLLSPAVESSGQMRELRDGLNLAYGLHRDKAPHLVRAMSSRPLLVCLCTDLGSIEVDV